MGRPRKVTREQALASALDVFWAKGYSASSIEDLQSSMGLQRGSFYFSFKDKQSLFIEVLQYYRETVVEPRRAKVRAAKTGLKGIQLFFNSLLTHSVTDRRRPGCLNTNTALEAGVFDGKDRRIATQLAAGFKGWEDFWVETVNRAKRDGSLRASASSRATARQLIVLTQGFNVIAKVCSDRKTLRAFIADGLAGITRD